MRARLFCLVIDQVPTNHSMTFPDFKKHWEKTERKCYDYGALVHIRNVGECYRAICATIPREVRIRMKKTLCLTLLFLGAGVLLSIGIPIDSTHAADSPQITIAYSSNMLGYLEPCG